MDRFVVDLVECPSVSRTSAVAQTFRPAVSEEYSPVFFCWGVAADAYPLVVVESDTIEVSILQSVESDKARVSVLPVAGYEFPAVFLGKVAFDVVGLGVGPPCLRMDSEETLLTLTDERAPLARTAHGVESLKYATQVTASVWMPFKQTYNGVSGDADFDSFEMAPWDAGGIHGDR